MSICEAPESDIRVKSNCRLNLQRASVFNFERLDYGNQSDILVKSYCRLNFLRVSVFNL